MDPLKIYDYLTKARERALDAVRALSPEQYQRSFTFGLKTIGSTLTHIMVSEGYYIQRIEGRAVPPYDQWPIKYENPPVFEVIERTWREQAKKTRAVVAAERDWARTITWLSFPDDSSGGGNKRFHITCTAGDIFTQLALHEVHHRAQIMAMLRELGRPLEDLDYNALMYQRVEATAGA
jgi:uncharacterized damage-inducible protein DinB